MKNEVSSEGECEVEVESGHLTVATWPPTHQQKQKCPS